jgi:hypothetical protein
VNFLKRTRKMNRKELKELNEWLNWRRDNLPRSEKQIEDENFWEGVLYAMAWVAGLIFLGAFFG